MSCTQVQTARGTMLTQHPAHLVVLHIVCQAPQLWQGERLCDLVGVGAVGVNIIREVQVSHDDVDGFGAPLPQPLLRARLGLLQVELRTATAGSLGERLGSVDLASRPCNPPTCCSGPRPAKSVGNY